MLAEWRFVPQWRAIGAFYFNRITDLIATVTDPSDDLLVNVNEQSVIGRGLEAEVEVRTSFGLEVFRAATTQLGEIPLGSPRTQLKGRLAQSFADDPGGPVHRQDRIPQPGRQFWLKFDYALR